MDKFLKEMSEIEIRDLGVVNKFLGFQISLNEEVGYELDQECPSIYFSKIMDWRREKEYELQLLKSATPATPKNQNNYL